MNDDDRFSCNALRMQNRTALVTELETYFKQRNTDDWVNLLNQAGIPAGPILNIPQMHKDPQALAREMIVDVEHPHAGTVRTLGAPVKFHGTPGSINCAAPLLGQHSREVLAEAGFAAESIERFIEQGVIEVSPPA